MPHPSSQVETLLANPQWHAERHLLRGLLLAAQLTETVKWGKLCYSHNDGNLAIVYGLKDCCAVGFFKGALLDDPHSLLTAPGENSQAMRMFKFTSAAEITRQNKVINDFIQQAISLEKQGRKINFTEKHQLEFPPELQAAFTADPALHQAFTALTPGRQRGYNLLFSAPKQSTTRTARIEKARARILAGLGPNDRPDSEKS